jgi:hypothetical protein
VSRCQKATDDDSENGACSGDDCDEGVISHGSSNGLNSTLSCQLEFRSTAYTKSLSGCRTPILRIAC